ncbi:MAG: GerW family sporulation protein [Oscillospiraceae bacterium]
MAEKVQHPVNDLLGETIEKIKQMVDSNTVVGTPIPLAEGTVVLPVSKISYGFASGGSDIGSSKTPKDLFGGGSGAGVTATPVAFLVCKKNGDVRILNVCNHKTTSMDKVIDIMPDMVDKVASFIPNPNEKNKPQEEEKL